MKKVLRLDIYTYLSIKTIKKQILSINNSIESYFNKLRYFKSNDLKKGSGPK